MSGDRLADIVARWGGLDPWDVPQQARDDAAWLVAEVERLERERDNSWNAAIEESAAMACSCCDNPGEIRKLKRT